MSTKSLVADVGRDRRGLGETEGYIKTSGSLYGSLPSNDIYAAGPSKGRKTGPEELSSGVGDSCRLRGDSSCRVRGNVVIRMADVTMKIV